MCGIVGAVARRNITPILIEGLRRLEYRGYDSAGIAIRDSAGKIQRIRSVGKVASLQQRMAEHPIEGELGIAHTRWATHGMPAERNAHPHMSGEQVAVVHNGIIENHAELREELKAKGYHFSSETDTEVIAHLMADAVKAGNDLCGAFKSVVKRLVGAYSLAVASPDDPDRIVVARAGSPWLSAWVRGRILSPPTCLPCSPRPSASSSWKRATWPMCAEKVCRCSTAREIRWSARWSRQN